jgi:hypothetical protein
MSELKVNKISPATGTAFTLGDSGDTFTVPSGATFTNSGTATGFGGGKILQVVSTTLTSTVSGNANSWADVTGLAASITPSATSSKILVTCSLTYASPSTNNAMVRLERGGTGLCIGDAAGSRTRGTMKMERSNSSGNESGAIVYLDSPSTTSSTEYYIQARSSSDTGTWYFNRAEVDGDAEAQCRGASTITLMEIDGS